MVSPRKISRPEDLAALREQARREVELRTGPKEVQVTVHMGTCGIAAGARDILTTLAEELAAVSAEVTLRQTGCAGLCDQEPMLTLRDRTGREFCYGRLDKAKVREIVHQHVLGGNPVVAYLVRT